MAYKVSIYQEQWNGALSIVIWEERNGRVFVAKPVDMVLEEVTDGLASAPTLRFGHFAGAAMLKAFAEALDEHGVKTDSDAKLSGTIAAQTKHLEDLRHLLKLPQNAEGK